MIIHIIVLLIGFLSASPGVAEPAANETSGEAAGFHTISVVRGKPIKLSEISAIADVSSARDQKGNPVELEGDEYIVGSFTRTTLTIVPPEGKPQDVITLDLKKQPD